MTDEELIKLLRADAELTDDIGLSDSAANRLESLRKQLAECQAREKVLREVLKLSWSEEYVNGIETGKKAEEAIAMPFDSTALDEAIKQGQRELLFEVADITSRAEGQSGNDWGDGYTAATNDIVKGLRRVAEELK